MENPQKSKDNLAGAAAADDHFILNFAEK